MCTYCIFILSSSICQQSGKQVQNKYLHGRNFSPILAMPAQKGAEATGVSASSQTMNAYVIAIKVNIFIYVMV